MFYCENWGWGVKISVHFWGIVWNSDEQMELQLSWEFTILYKWGSAGWGWFASTRDEVREIFVWTVWGLRALKWDFQCLGLMDIWPPDGKESGGVDKSHPKNFPKVICCPKKRCYTQLIRPTSKTPRNRRWDCFAYGCWSRYLKIASHGPFRLAASLNLEQLSTCRQLEELFLGGFRGRDLESFCQRSCRSLWFHEQRWGAYMGVVVTDDMVDILDGMMLWCYDVMMLWW